MASGLAALLRGVGGTLLCRPPAASPAGAALFCCTDAPGMAARLTAAPRLAIHRALEAPHAYLGGGPALGMSPDMEDACVAYHLFCQV